MYTKMARYCEIVRKYYTDPAYIDVLNQMQQMYKGITKSNKNKYIFKNLRMTITEY
jgi:flagellum-specific peptidoglycan hydrolase FlgJ